MFVAWSYWIWTRGSISGSVTMGLDPWRRYLVTGGLTGKSGSAYGQVFISVLCEMRGDDQVLCGIREESNPPEWNIANLGVYEFVDRATRVTIELRGDGNLHRAEGAIFDIT